jgi:CBS domain-containing protein
MEETMNAADIMTTNVATCVAGDTLNRATQIMWDRRCGSVAVLDGTGAVAGVLTDRDVAMAAYTQGRRLDDISVETGMSRPALTCLPTATIEEVEDLMMANAVRRIVVVDGDGRLQGLVSIDDIARCGAAWDGDADIDLERAALALGEISRRTTTLEGDGPEQPETDLVADSLGALKTLRDEMRVDLNLASKEVRDRWRRLETCLRAAEARARLTQGGARSFATLLESAREFRRGLRQKPNARERRAQQPAQT